MAEKLEKTRAEELIDFIQNHALGRTQASAKEVKDAVKELHNLLPDLPDVAGPEPW